MKIHLFGASGSGVTTLGEQLAQTLQSVYLDADYYYWESSEIPFTIRRNPEARKAMLKQDMAGHPHWVIGGSLISW